MFPGDWIVGFLDKKNDYRFLYAMEVSERLHMNDYFHDLRFARKRPVVSGTARQSCGDDIYSFSSLGIWQQHETIYHGNQRAKLQDTKHPFIFVGKRFWYLGRESSELPQRFRLLAGGRGARVNHDPKIASEFKAWVEDNFSLGIHALPRDLLLQGAA